MEMVAEKKIELIGSVKYDPKQESFNDRSFSEFYNWDGTRLNFLHPYFQPSNAKCAYRIPARQRRAQAEEAGK